MMMMMMMMMMVLLLWLSLWLALGCQLLVVCCLSSSLSLFVLSISSNSKLKNSTFQVVDDFFIVSPESFVLLLSRQVARVKTLSTSEINSVNHHESGQ